VTTFRAPFVLPILAGFGAIATPAAAADGVRLDYRAPAGCPSEAAFVEAIQARGARLEAPPPEFVGARSSVSLEHAAAGVTGFLQLTRVDLPANAREVHGAECAEAMQGLAVIAALLLHPTADAAPHPVGAEPPVSRKPRPLPVPVDSQRLQSIGQFATERIQVGPGTLTFDHGSALTLSGGIAAGVIPSVLMPRYDLTLSRVNFVTTPDGSHYLAGGWVPHVRWTLLGSGTRHDGEFSTRALGIKAALGGCTSITYDLGGAVVLLCSEFGTGVMALETRNAAGEKIRSKSFGLGSVGLDLESEYNLGGPFHLALRLGSEASLTQVSAQRPDGSELFHTSVFSTYVLAGVGLHF
jgi:hypothetical protein